MSSRIIGVTLSEPHINGTALLAICVYMVQPSCAQWVRSICIAWYYRHKYEIFCCACSCCSFQGLSQFKSSMFAHWLAFTWIIEEQCSSHFQHCAGCPQAGRGFSSTVKCDLQAKRERKLAAYVHQCERIATALGQTNHTFFVE